LGKYHEDTGKTYYWVGRSLCKLEEHDEALVAFSRAMRIFVCVFAQNHKYRKWTDTAIADAFNEINDPDVDYNLYKAALDDSISHEAKGDRFRKNKLFAQGKDHQSPIQDKNAKMSMNAFKKHILIDPLNKIASLQPFLSIGQQSKPVRNIIQILRTYTAKLQLFYAEWGNLRWLLKRIVLLLKFTSYRLGQNILRQ